MIDYSNSNKMLIQLPEDKNIFIEYFKSDFEY